MNGLVALVGLGAVGAPIANLLSKKYKDNFILLSSKQFLGSLTEKDIYINGEIFKPTIISDPDQLQERISLIIVAVKNYHIASLCPFLKNIVDRETVILPIQNGLYSYNFFKSFFPNNFILEGFAKGPNTKKINNSYEYQRAGELHIGTSSTLETHHKTVKEVYSLLKEANIECYYENDIRHEVWKKLMLNVAGNAITAITGLDYSGFKFSTEVQDLCRRVMKEFIIVAQKKGIELTDSDIDDVIDYYLSFKVSKHTSMLEDIINKRKTENDYLAGFISKLSKEIGVSTPSIDVLYSLVKIIEDNY